ncbi:sporulation initiation factor Spo0A C-terminal domain-containing protein [Allofournierella sp.]|uniref:sporulation initiation factor Spo0A C-terminal domain-containing protein n=1 Tax=Allofournierella sp. TaxID=1940256 RepID=UPI003AF1D194
MNIEREIFEELNRLGVPANLRGRDYIETAIELLMNVPGMGQQITRKLYPSVAKQYDTTPNRAERAIRHAVEVSWERGDPDTLRAYFGHTVRPTIKPTNSEYLCMVARRLAMRIDEGEG